MASQPMRITRESRQDPQDFSGVRLGHLVAIDEAGHPLVTVSGSPAAAVAARVATADPRPTEAAVQAKPAVLLMFEDGDPRQPVIVGFVREVFAPAAAVAPVADQGHPVELNGKTLIFEGQDEIVLRCGLGSLTIRADGQIVVKGTRLISRASETNKIRGASVQIN